MTDDAFRRAMSRLPGGVSVIAARSGEQDHVAVTTSLVSVSLDPPMVMMALHSESRILELVGPGRVWAASFVTAAARRAVEWIAEPGRPALGQLTGIAHRRSEATGLALLSEASAWLECRTDWVKSAGDHDVIVGEVVSVRLGAGERGGLAHRLGRLIATA